MVPPTLGAPVPYPADYWATHRRAVLGAVVTCGYMVQWHGSRLCRRVSEAGFCASPEDACKFLLGSARYFVKAIVTISVGHQTWPLLSTDGTEISEAAVSAAQ